MLATIQIKDWKLSALVGVHEAERQTHQDILVSVSARYDVDQALLSDSLFDALDYEKLTADIAARVLETRFFLLETLAAFILQRVLERPLVVEASVRIAKPRVLSSAGEVSVEMCQSRSPAPNA